MDNLLLARLLTAGGLQNLLANVTGTGLEAAASGAAGSGQDQPDLLNLAMMQALTDEAKAILKQELQRSQGNLLNPKVADEDPKAGHGKARHLPDVAGNGWLSTMPRSEGRMCQQRQASSRKAP